MLESTLKRFGRTDFEAPFLLSRPPVEEPVHDTPIDLKRLEGRLRAARALAQPGFMTLHAVREGVHIVDFEWDSASVEATRLLRGCARGLVGERLVDVLAGLPGRGAVFEQYRRVVEFGAAQAVMQPVDRNHCIIDVLRHAAVRLGDGVAVRLINLRAVRREVALQREIYRRTMIVRREVALQHELQRRALMAHASALA